MVGAGSAAWAAAATCAGWVWSYWTNSFSWWPLTPPFAFTHAKYALIMFGPSLKSVPGCSGVDRADVDIGVPVAATPGLDPHFDVSVEAAVVLPGRAAKVELDACA